MAENEAVVENDEEVLEDELDENATDWQAEARKAHGTAKRYKTKADKLKADLEAERKKSAALAGSDKKKDEPDYAKLAYLEAKGLTSDEDIAWVEGQAKETGKSLRDLFGTKWFQEELKERKEVQASKDALPSGSKRSGNNATSDVAYWVAKGGLPKDPDLARKVVNARMAAEKAKSTFTERPLA